MPVIADESFGIGPKSWQYGVLYACFGLGAALGAVSVGTMFARVSKTKLLRPAFLAFAAVLAVFAFLRAAAFAYPVAWCSATCFRRDHRRCRRSSSRSLVDEERGRVMALWIMGFGGTVPVGVLVGGWVGHRRRSCGDRGRAVWAVVLGAWSNAHVMQSQGAPDV